MENNSFYSKNIVFIVLFSFISLSLSKTIVASNKRLITWGPSYGFSNDGKYFYGNKGKPLKESFFSETAGGSRSDSRFPKEKRDCLLKEKFIEIEKLDEIDLKDNQSLEDDDKHSYAKTDKETLKEKINNDLSDFRFSIPNMDDDTWYAGFISHNGQITTPYLSRNGPITTPYLFKKKSKSKTFTFISRSKIKEDQFLMEILPSRFCNYSSW